MHKLVSVYVIGRFGGRFGYRNNEASGDRNWISSSQPSLFFLLVKTLVTSQINKKIMNYNPLDMFGTGTYTVKYDCQV